MDLSKLSDDERERLSQLVDKASESSTDDPEFDPHSEPREWGAAPRPNPPTVRRVPDPATWVEKQIRGIETVGRDNYLAGVKSPKKDPIKAGIDAQAKYEAKMKDPTVLARRKAGLEKTNMDEWAVMAETLGADKLVDGVVKRRHKVERFVAAWTPKLEGHLKKIDALADVTPADREKRMIENLRGLKALKGT